MSPRKLITEMIGTFFLVLVIGLSIPNAGNLAPLAIGTILMVMVYMGGHVSGGHYNPAVSFAVFLRGKLPAGDLVPYWVSQVVGAFLAAMAVTYLTGRAFAGPAPGEGVDAARALLVEVLFTFALALSVLSTATAQRTANNSYFGLAIGFTVTAGAFAGGPISGGAFNPAVGTGPILHNMIHAAGSGANLWVYIVGPLVGGALAAAVFRLQNPEG